jgi:hypothetical protein
MIISGEPAQSLTRLIWAHGRAYDELRCRYAALDEEPDRVQVLGLDEDDLDGCRVHLEQAADWLVMSQNETDAAKRDRLLLAAREEIECVCRELEL